MENLWKRIETLEDAKGKICSGYPKNKSFSANLNVISLLKGPKVLDFGAGIGRNTEAMVQEGFEVYFYDYPNMIKLAKNHMQSDVIDNITWLECGKTDLKDYHFDSVLASLVFQHIPKTELEQILKDLNCSRLVILSRGYLDDNKHNIWPIILEKFIPITELDEKDGTDKHQIVILRKR